MIEVAIMLEGQNGLTWERWQRIARAVEDLGFVGLYRSDHYTNVNPPDRESLELWVSLTWLASHTSRIEFGPMVSPVSFRQPTMTARMASAVDDLSNGRLHLGLGAGWQEREHHNYSWELLDMDGRFARFEEGLQIISHLLQKDEPLDFDGDYYQLHDAVLLPRPQRPGGPPILIGGNGPKRTLPLVAQYATEWNGVYIPPKTFAERSAQLDELLVGNGRHPSEVRRSLMTGLVFGKDQADFDAKMAQRTVTAAELRERGLVVGTGNELADQLEAFAEAGVQRIMLQWIDLDDMAGLEALGRLVGNR
ncbi:MAG: TIGR03560 family F420-dependent LLM class oxidoreductase [Anaerolineae bacterium]|nr:TIGR03560 family F420-dependent LLM class oxidoreductase [Anaerolineae bacterium]